MSFSGRSVVVMVDGARTPFGAGAKGNLCGNTRRRPRRQGDPRTHSPQPKSSQGSHRRGRHCRDHSKSVTRASPSAEPPHSSRVCRKPHQVSDRSQLCAGAMTAACVCVPPESVSARTTSRSPVALVHGSPPNG